MKVNTTPRIQRNITKKEARLESKTKSIDKIKNTWIYDKTLVSTLQSGSWIWGLFFISNPKIVSQHILNPFFTTAF